MIDPDGIRQRYAALSSILDERGRRLLVAAEAKAAGYGGIAAVWRATRVATSTIGRGLRELAEAPALTAGRARRAGGGRKPAVAADPDLMRDLKALVEPTARRSRGAAALDLQEPAPACRRASGPGPSDQPHAGGRVAARARLQPAGQRQNPRGVEPPGSGCAVRLHRCPGQDGAGGRRAGDLGGRQEEGACRRLSERRAGVASQGGTRSGAGARLPDQGAGAGGAVRRL